MKRTIQLILTTLLFSCAGEKAENWAEASIQIDTLMIDSGDALIFHQYGLSHSSLTADEKQLLNFTPNGELEILDLDNLKLQQKKTLEREGPLGTGMPFAIQTLPSGGLVFYGFNELRVFNADLTAMEHYATTENDLAGIAPEMLTPFVPKIYADGLVYTTYETNEQVPQGLAVVSLADKSVKKIPLDIADRIVPYTYSLYIQGRLGNRSHEPINLTRVGKKILLSTAFANEVLLVDPEKGTSEVKTFHSELTQDQRPKPTKTSAETINEFSDIVKEGDNNVKFGPFYVDSASGRLWRFSRELGDAPAFKTVLTVFDQDLNQLMERELMVDPFLKKFFKDGKLWSYVNVEDELGFAVMNLKFQD